MLRNLHPRVSSLLTAVKYHLMQKKKIYLIFFIVYTFIRILSCFFGGRDCGCRVTEQNNGKVKFNLTSPVCMRRGPLKIAAIRILSSN